MSKELPFVQDVLVSDNKDEIYFGDFRVAISNRINDPFMVMPAIEVFLTAETARTLISHLQSALELLGEDFLIHYGGSIDITDEETYHSTRYATLADYQSGTPKVEDED
jgi:hypothetical protein